MIRVCGTGVQNVRIRQELNITDIKDHVQRQAHTGFFQHAQGFLLCVRQRGDDSCVAEAAEGADVVWVPSGIIVRC